MTPGGPAFRIVGGPQDGRRLELDTPLVLGRTDEADVVLPDPNGQLSRRHARVSAPDGHGLVEDLESTNGTFVNGRQVWGPTPVEPGDKVTLGDVVLVFEPGTAPAPVASGASAAGSAREAEIKVIDGPLAGKTVAVSGSALIGRNPDADFVIDDAEVSREHAKITLDADGAQLHDLRSANGTYVNGVRVLEPYQLHSGDRVSIGQTTFEFTAPDFASTAAVAYQASGARDIVAHSAALLSDDEPGSRKWWTLAVVSVTTFMLLLDTTIVAIALPSISTSLDASFTDLQWVVDAYTLMLAAMLLASGTMADIFGRKRVLLIGLAIFLAASLASALSRSPLALDIARGFQGIGGSMMFACALSLIVQEFPANERGVAFGVFGAVNSLSVAVGPILGGFLTEGFGWESIFFLNLPIGIVTFIVAQRKLVNLPGPPTTIDWGGLVTLSSALLLLVYGIIKGNDNGWTSGKSLGLFGGAIVLLILFVIIEKHREQPMFDLSLLRVPTFLGVNVVVFALTGSIIACVFFMTTWLQSIQDYGPIAAGLRLAALTLIALPVAPLAGKLVGKIHPRIPLGVGLTLVALGLALLSRVDTNSSWTVLLPGLLVCGLGMGMVNPQVGATAVAIVPPYRAGMASGANSTARELGVTVGIAALGALMQHTVTTRTNELLSGTVFDAAKTKIGDAISAGGTQILLDGQDPANRDPLAFLARTAYADGLHKVFLVAAALAAVGALAGFLLVRTKDVLTMNAGRGH